MQGEVLIFGDYIDSQMDILFTIWAHKNKTYELGLISLFGEIGLNLIA